MSSILNLNPPRWAEERLAYTEDGAYIEDDTTGDSVEVYNSEEPPVYDYSDITDSGEEEPVSKKSTRMPHPTSNHMDVTIRKQVGEMKRNSGQSTGVSCLLLILTLTVHWMFVRFSISRRPRPRRVIQIRRRPAHLH